MQTASKKPRKSTKKNNWQSTSEKHPPNFKKVLARDQHKHPHIAYYDSVTNAWYGSNDILLDINLTITEWQPIPN